MNFLSRFTNILRPQRGNGKQNIFINKVDVRPIYRQSQDIQKWRNAIIAAEGINQQRYMLFELYHDMFSDGILARIVKKRVEAITNQTLCFTVNGKKIEEINKLTQSSAFHTFCEEVVLSKIWGHSLLELFWQPANSKEKHITALIPRSHVKPRYGIVTQNKWDINGTNYTQSTQLNLIEVGNAEDLGELMAAAQYVIYKRGSFGDWVGYTELFGMPFRWATYNNEQSRAVLEEALEKAGSAGYVVAPNDAQLQFLGNQGHTGNDVYKLLRDACNEEMTISILGNTMTTTEAKHSGFAQSYTHAATQEEVHHADRKFLLNILNEKVIPYLESLGYQTNGGEWSFEDKDKTPLTERVKIDMLVSTVAPIGESYWYEKYSIPKPTPEELAKIKAAAESMTDNNEEEQAASKAIKKKT